MDMEQLVAFDSVVIDPSLMDATAGPVTGDVAGLQGPSDAQQPDQVQAGDDADMRSKFQVCTNCRTKKRKCNLERPACSLCRRNGWACEYRYLKKRPGPPKSSVDQRSSMLSQKLKRLEELLAAGGQPSQPLAPVSGPNIQQPFTEVPTTCHSDIIPFLATASPSVDELVAYGEASPLPDETRAILIFLYFEHVQSTFPMFRRPIFDADIRDNKIPDALLYLIFALASRFIPSSDIPRTFGLNLSEPWEHFARLAFKKSRFNEENESDSPMSLNDVKISFLLTLHEYTSFPGPKAWMRVGNTVRAAIAAGIHQLDRPDNWRFSSLSDAEKEEWRFVWWAVWRVDSSINVLACSPFGINTCDIHIALPSTSVEDFTNGITTPCSGNFLQADPIKSWRSHRGLQQAVSEDTLNIYFKTVSYNREAITCRQRLRANPTPEMVADFRNMKSILPYLQVELPTSFFNGAKRPVGESFDQHRQRLETLLLLHITQIVLHLPFRRQNFEEANNREKKRQLADWQLCVDNVEDIAALFRHWGPHYSKLSDPMVCCTIWICCSILTLHTMSASYKQVVMTDPENTILDSLELLAIALEGFSRYWPIAGLLTKSLESLRSWNWLSLDFPDILSVAAHFQVPIDPQSPDPGAINIWPAIMDSKQVMFEASAFLE